MIPAIWSEFMWDSKILKRAMEIGWSQKSIKSPCEPATWTPGEIMCNCSMRHYRPWWYCATHGEVTVDID